jgi:hypothetical protein
MSDTLADYLCVYECNQECWKSQVSSLGQSGDVGTKGCTSDSVTGNYVTTVAAVFGNRHWLFAVTVSGGTSNISKQEMND